MRVRWICGTARGLVMVLALRAAPAGATWSIVAVDPETREVGVAGASCITGAEVLARVVPGHGAVAAQAIPNLAARDELAARLARGESPAEAVAAVTSAAYDHLAGLPTVRLRQYGAAALGFAHEPASFTGAWTIGWAGARAGEGVTVQGNMLAGPAVVEDALAAFERRPAGCRRALADRLLEALEAGARAGGDRRCSPALAALSAFLVVARPADAPDRPWLHLSRTRPGAALRSPLSDLRRLLLLGQERGTWEESPVRLLREAYDAQRPPAPSCE